MVAAITNHKLDSHKYPALDSLRGIAAVMVIFQHLWEMSYLSDDRLRPWWFFCAGHEAVILFFVLSGFVLSHQLRLFRFEHYHQFVFKRVMRIYPAYYAALLFSGIMLVVANHHFAGTLTNLNLQPWFYIWSQTTFDKTLWLGSLTLITHEGSSLNVAVWSLYFEMWLSLAFPLLLWLLFRAAKPLRITVLAVLFMASIYLWSSGRFMDDQWESLLYYAWYFMLGMVIYHYQPWLRKVAGSWWLILGLLLYFCNYWLCGWLRSRLVQEVIIAGGSFLLIVNAIHFSIFQQVLGGALFKFYGKISYSLYLFHLPLLYSLTYILANRVEIGALKVIIFIVATIVATLSYYAIEKPAVRFANRMLGR